MKIKNTSDGSFNLKSGKLEPGEEGEATYEECQVLFSSNKAEVVQDNTSFTASVTKPAPKKAAKRG